MAPLGEGFKRRGHSSIYPPIRRCQPPQRAKPPGASRAPERLIISGTRDGSAEAGRSTPPRFHSRTRSSECSLPASGWRASRSRGSRPGSWERPLLQSPCALWLCAAAPCGCSWPDGPCGPISGERSSSPTSCAKPCGPPSFCEGPCASLSSSPRSHPLFVVGIVCSGPRSQYITSPTLCQDGAPARNSGSTLAPSTLFEARAGGTIDGGGLRHDFVIAAVAVCSAAVVLVRALIPDA